MNVFQGSGIMSNAWNVCMAFLEARAGLFANCLVAECRIICIMLNRIRDFMTTGFFARLCRYFANRRQRRHGPAGIGHICPEPHLCSSQ